MARQAATGTNVQDLEEQQALLENQGGPGNSTRPIAGTLLVAGGLVSVFVVVFSAFLDNWLWPILGLMLLIGHGLLLKATADKDGLSRLSSVALACETLAYLALVATYFFRSFMVPHWWWVANAFLLLLAAGVLTALVCHLCCGSSSTEKASTLGYFLLAFADLLVALLLILAGSAAVQEWIRSLIPTEVQGLIATLQTSTRSFRGPQPSFPTCDLTTSSCSLADFEQKQWTVVRAGGSTSCLVGDFQFLVYKGDPGKVVLHLHGGGACWNWVTFVLNACTWDWTSTMNFGGIFDPSNRANPFYGYTMINVPYCSGDIFGGAKENFWILANQTASAWKKQSGYANLDAVMTWTEAQFQKDGGLDQLTNFVVSGESAGSLGLQVWGSTILNRLKGQYDPKGTYLILDSFVGAMVDNKDLLQRQVMDFWNFCDSGVVPPSLQSKCHPDTLFLRDFVNDTLTTFPDVRYLPVDSKFDEVQIAFADMLMFLDNLWTLVTQGLDKVPLFNNTGFYSEISEKLARFVSFPQFSVYLVDSDQHTYTGYPLRDILRVTPAGSQNDCSDPDVGERLLPWLTPREGQQPPFQCYDLLRDSPEWTAMYCSDFLPWVAGKCGKLSAEAESEKVAKSEADKPEKVDKPEEVDKADKSEEDKAEK
ncbi:unnamed protein product [Symbiodinium sp. CCMP2592]|nr:unnamed protein product [Symbiodinium sp. CCMP2592]